MAHPPGFPVWTLYSWLFVKLLPFSNIAWRVAVGSAVAAALACGLVALMVSRGGMLLLENRVALRRWKPADQGLLRLTCGCVAGMALGFSTPVWRDALKAEVWSLSLCLFSVVLCFLMRWMMRPWRRRFLLGAVFAFGLVLTSTQELIVVAPALLLLVLLGDLEIGRDLALPVVLLAVTAWVMSLLGMFWWLGSNYVGLNACLLCVFLVVGAADVIAIAITRRFGSQWKLATLCGLVFVLALGCNLYLPLASMTNPPMNWGHPRTVEAFVHAITRGQYERPRPTNELGPFIAQLWAITKATGKSFDWLYLPFAALPVCWLPWTQRSARNWMLGLAAVFSCTGPVMVATLSPAAERGRGPGRALVRSDVRGLGYLERSWTHAYRRVYGQVRFAEGTQ